MTTRTKGKAEGVPVKISMHTHIAQCSFVKNRFWRLATVAIWCALSAGSAFGATEQQKRPHDLRILVAYFSHSGNTRYLAEQVHARVGGDIVEIKPLKPYPRNYDSVVDQAKREQGMKFRPQLTGTIPNIRSYDIVFIGYPNWWGTMPMALFTFFEKNDFSGKTLIPFCTHEGSYLGRSVTDLKALNPRSTILGGLAIRGRSVRDRSAQKDITAWLTSVDYRKTRQTR
jgi:flavodoxin